MLLATMAVLLQFPFAPAGKAPAPPQRPAAIYMAENNAPENTPAKLPSPAANDNLFPPATNTDLFDRDKIRLVDLSDGAAPDNDKNDGTKSVGLKQASNDSEESSSLLAEVRIPTHVEPEPPGDYHPRYIAAERPGHTWLALSIVEHGAATFDAWTTNRAIGQGHTEMNPTLRPFAGHATMYGAVQVGPLIFDYLGHRMMRSDKRWIHQVWWLPQSLSSAASLFAGAHNLSVAR